MCALVEGRSGVVCYGEIAPSVKVGQILRKGDLVGQVEKVLKDGKLRLDIPGHSESMLHLELYKPGTRVASKSWKHDLPKHDYLMDPTPMLSSAIGAPRNFLTWEKPLRSAEGH